ncbi:hypothetical protein AN643_00590 [Candidatus Epulonipiscioides saccharophilum]|nr:hypothetical protein AN643_00590 [Epulopiscium sp. SCG-B10WGA-EpuloB]
MSGNEASQLGVAHDIVLYLLDSSNANTRPVIPVDFVIDPNTELPYSDSAINNLPSASITDIENYIEDLLKKAINNEEIGIDVRISSITDPNIPTYEAPTNISEGSIEGFTVVLTDNSIATPNTWTIQNATGSSSANQFITDGKILEIEIAKLVDKWNAISKADIFHAASLLRNAYESEELLVDHYSYNYASTKIENTQMIAKIFKKQIEELIANPFIRVDLYAESEDENIDLSTSSATKSLTDDSQSVDAIRTEPIPGTIENEQGTAGEFECKVVLAIDYDEIAGGGGRAFDSLEIENYIAEVENDKTTSSGNDLDMYTVITEDPIIVKIEAQPYSIPTISDTIAVAEAMKVLPSAPSGFTLEDPANTIALANAQISAKINDLLMAEKSGYDPELSRNVKFEIVEDFSGANNGFVEPKAPSNNGSYKFKIRFKQNKAELTEGLSWSCRTALFTLSVSFAATFRGTEGLSA